HASVAVPETFVQPDGARIRCKCVEANGLISQCPGMLLGKPHEKSCDASLLVGWTNHQSMDNGRGYPVDPPRDLRVLGVLVFVEHQRANEWPVMNRSDIHLTTPNIGDEGR